MKKFIQLVLKGILVSSMLCLIQMVSGQDYLYFTSTPDSTAIIDKEYSYIVTTAAHPTPVTFSLTKALDGMTISPLTSTTAEITWTPDTMTAGGKVIVHADNGMYEQDQTYFLYITDEIICDPELIAYYKLDESTGPVYEDFSSGYDATVHLSDSPIPSEGIVDSAQRFQPANIKTTYLDVEDQNQFEWSGDDDFSISVWFKNRNKGWPEDWDKPEVLVGRSTTNGYWWFGWMFYDEHTGYSRTPFFEAATGTDTIRAYHNDNVLADTVDWHHCVVAFQGSPTGGDYVQIYHNGIQKTHSVGAMQNDFTSDDILTLGYFNLYPAVDANHYPVSGFMDEVLIYDRSLSQSEVTEIYNDGLVNRAHCKPGNVAPLITSDPLTDVDEDDPYNYQLQYREIDAGDMITLSALVLPSWLDFNTGTGLLSGTPDNDNVGDTTVTLMISDGTVDIQQIFTLTVSNTNDDPVITSTAPTAVDEDEPYSYTFEAEDVDAGDTITLSAEVIPAWLNFNATSGVLSGTPTNDEVGLNPTANFDVTLRATDLSLAYDEESFVITVTNINDAPVISSQNAIETDEDIAREIVFADLNVTDVDDTYPDDFTLNVQNGNNYSRTGNTITPAQDWYGELTVPITLSDGDSIKNYDLSVTVNSVNDSPEFTSTPVTEATEGSDYIYWFSAQDVEDASLTFTAVKKPDWLNISSTALAGILQGQPGYQDAGRDSVVLRVEDSEAAFDEQIFVIDIEDKTAIKDNKVRLINSVYPNPANKNEMVIFKLNDFAGKSILQIFNILGETVTEINVLNEEIIKLNITEYKSGLYLYTITNKNNSQTGRLLIK
jgi:hypothetical protein